MIYRCVIILLLSSLAKGQEKIPLVAIPAKVINFITVDRAGDLYAVSEDTIKKYDINGKLLHMIHLDGITNFDSGNGVRLLVYQAKTNMYSILSPTLEIITTKEIDPSIAIEPTLLCSSGDYNYWLLDEVDYSLKKIDGRLTNVLLDFKLDTADWGQPQISYMKEYQNFLFVLEQDKGIAIYNSIGQHLQTISGKIKNFYFMGEELYYLTDQLHFVDLFTGEESLLSVPSADMVIITDIRLYALTGDMLYIYNRKE